MDAVKGFKFSSLNNGVLRSNSVAASNKPNFSGSDFFQKVNLAQIGSSVEGLLSPRSFGEFASSVGNIASAIISAIF